MTATEGTVIENIGINEIIDMIPHRYPFLLVDKIKTMTLGKDVVGIKNVTMNEQFFTGHFPGNPVMPGVLIIEAMAQTSAVLVTKTLNAEPNSKTVLFMSIDGVKFRKPVLPGDTLEMHVEIIKNKANVWVMKGQSFVDGKKVTEATFSAMIFDKK